MDVRSYLKTLSPPEQTDFASRCGTSIGYIRKQLSLIRAGKKRGFGESLVIAFERESGGKVRCESELPDVDWAYIRGSAKSPSITVSRKRA